MVRLSQKIQAELENIDELFKELPPHSSLPRLSTLELAGVAALLLSIRSTWEDISYRRVALGIRLRSDMNRNFAGQVFEIFGLVVTFRQTCSR